MTDTSSRHVLRERVGVRGTPPPLRATAEPTTGHSDSLHGHPAARAGHSGGYLHRIQRPSDVLDPGHTRGYIRAGAVLSSYRMVLHPKSCEPGRIRLGRVGSVEDSAARM